MKYRTKTACVYDHGLFASLAERLAKDFGRVLYYIPWETGFPNSKDLTIGSGLPGVQRITSIWSHLDEIDLFVFPDVYDGPLQEHLASLGKRVWGARLGEELELYRDDAKRHMKAHDIPIGPYSIVKGTANLRAHLKQHKNQFVKVSLTRGDIESFHAKNYRLVEPVLDDLDSRLGALKNSLEFVVEDAIEPAVEAGYDGFTIDGRFPKQSLWGIEIKNRGYIGHIENYTALPPAVRKVNDGLSDSFRNYRYRGFWSTEIRVKPNGVGYMIDATCRGGSPPSELYQLMIGNLSDVIWEGAGGVLVEPEFTSKWGAELMIASEWATKKWQPIEFPKDVRDNIKIRNAAIIDGRNFFVPDNSESTTIGSVVADGKTMQDAIKECRRIADLVEGYFIEVDDDALNKAEKEFAKIDAQKTKAA